MRGFGKVILFGEHAVVYGYPALAAGLTTGISCEIGIEVPNGFAIRVPQWGLAVREDEPSPVGRALRIISMHIPSQGRYCELIVTPEIPSRAGLGSSAAMIVAIIKTILNWLQEEWPPEKINELAFQAECEFHGTPSGIDNTVANYGGFCYLCDTSRFELPSYSYKHISLKKVTAALLPSPSRPISLVIVNTKKERETRKLVEQVRHLYLEQTDSCKKIFEKIGSLAEEGYQSLIQGRYSTCGELMNQNHDYLRTLGVSCPEIEKAAELAHKAGALGAKLTGAGGGGCLIALGGGREEYIFEACQKQGFAAFIVQIG